MNIKTFLWKFGFITVLGVTFGLVTTPGHLMAESNKTSSKSKSHTMKHLKEKPADPAAATSTLKPTTVLKFDAKEVNGAKVWLPKQASVKAGETLTLEVHNSLEAPHGFKIEGYVPETAIGAGQTKSFTITPKQKGLLKVTCHLHPAHVGAEIQVQ